MSLEIVLINSHKVWFAMYTSILLRISENISHCYDYSNSNRTLGYRVSAAMDQIKSKHNLFGYVTSKIFLYLCYVFMFIVKMEAWEKSFHCDIFSIMTKHHQTQKLVQVGFDRSYISVEKEQMPILT